MGNKINPLGFRLGVNKTASARWYADQKTYPKLLVADEKIRKAVMSDVGHSGVARIDVERAAHNINITIHTAKPGVVIGRGGESIKALRAKLDDQIEGTIAVNVQEVPNPNVNGALVAQRIAEQLERRFAFRRAMKQAVQRTMESGAKGVKIRCSGRLGGSEQARPEQYNDGRVPLQTLRADIDYGTALARTQQGVVGVKAWVFHGEIMGEKQRRAANIPQPRQDEDRSRRRRPQGRRRPGSNERGERSERPSRSRPDRRNK